MTTNRRTFITLGLGGAALFAAGRRVFGADAMTKIAPTATGTASSLPSFWEKSSTQASPKVTRTADEWKSLLDAQQFDVLRHEGTERAFTGKYWNNHDSGVYHCAGCGLELWSSKEKFESGTGWPSFWNPVAKGRIEEKRDATLGMMRIEVHCARCGGHQGHLFDDGPEPTGLRYCINSVSTIFEKR